MNLSAVYYNCTGCAIAKKLISLSIFIMSILFMLLLLLIDIIDLKYFDLAMSSSVLLL